MESKNKILLWVWQEIYNMVEDDDEFLLTNILALQELLSRKLVKKGLLEIKDDYYQVKGVE